VKVTEHQVHAVRCPCCGKVTPGAFPSAVAAPTQYGLGRKAFVAYLDTYPLLPTERICELLYDLTGHRLSEGTLYNLNTTALVPAAPAPTAIPAATPPCVAVPPSSANGRVPPSLPPAQALPLLPPVCPDLTSALAAVASTATVFAAFLLPSVHATPSNPISPLVDRPSAPADPRHAHTQPPKPRARGHLLLPLGASP
jgi:hypothetical protein